MLVKEKGLSYLVASTVRVQSLLYYHALEAMHLVQLLDVITQWMVVFTVQDQVSSFISMRCVFVKYMVHVLRMYMGIVSAKSDLMHVYSRFQIL